ncbi:hypothetical protein ACRAWG_35870 [Methylobacterium sp. P31]
MSHKFKVGQRVRQFKIGYADAKSATGDLFEVTRLMPEDRSGEPSYRVKSATGERAMRESELALAS